LTKKTGALQFRDMISIQSLTMRYGSFTALDRVSFEVREGEILGLLGPNGAGKTTLMRILTTYLYPYSGTAEISGSDILKDPIGARQKTGYLPENVPIYPEMQVEEYLIFSGHARNLSGKALVDRLEWVKAECGLKPVWKHRLTELSKGYRQRTGLAQALIHDPEVLILDEPTSGLDPLQIIGIRQLIRTLAAKKTIIFSTHILQEVETLADRIVIINDGKIVANGTESELKKKASGFQQIRLAVREEEPAVRKALDDLKLCEEIQPLGISEAGYRRFRIRGRPGKSLLPEIDALVKAKNWALGELAEDDTGLEEVFIRLLASGKQEAAHG
ncbi:MAG TPA: ATP-binding cassette domain-containing protein, partial [Candidatus Omnitrophota bacterium]|nr:ATP-binding cassette domain-containing protein [Candidatus Omnitrophota bacterium]